MAEEIDQVPIVIIAEDHTSTRETLARLFTRKGCEVYPCRSAEEAHAKYGDLTHQMPPQQPTLLLTDRNMGAMTGIELLAQPDILSDHVMAKLMLTGQEEHEGGLENERQVVERLGARFYTKPVKESFFQDAYKVVDEAKHRMQRGNPSIADRHRNSRRSDRDLG